MGPLGRLKKQKDTQASMTQKQTARKNTRAGKMRNSLGYGGK